MLRLAIILILEQSVQVELFTARYIDFDLELHATEEHCDWLIKAAVDRVKCVNIFTTNEEWSKCHLQLV